MLILICQLFEQAQNKLNESLQRISLLNLSRQRILKNSSNKSALERPYSFHSHNSAATTSTNNSSSLIELPRAAPITGQLEVRLMGCQDLLDVVPDRQKRDTIFLPEPVTKTPKSGKISTGGSHKAYTLKGDQSSKAYNWKKLKKLNFLRINRWNNGNYEAGQ